MNSRRAVWVVLIIAVFAAGCAFWAKTPQTARQCSDTPKNAVLTFFEGIAETSIMLLKTVIVEGMSIFGIFGDGDTARGREIVKQLVRHPEVADAEAGCICSYKAMSDTDDPDVKLVTVLRKAAVDDSESMRLYERTFLVRFEPNGNCIIAVQPQRQGWTRVE